MTDTSFFDRIWFRVSSVGLADFSGIAALPGYRTPNGGPGPIVPDGTVVSYTATSDDELQWECGKGAYTAGVTARTTIYESSSGTAVKVNFIAPPRVRYDILAADILDFTNFGGNPGVEFIFQNGGNALVANQQGDLEIQSDCVLRSVTLIADQTGSCIVNIWRCSYAQFDDSNHPTVFDKITGSNPPVISGGVKYNDATLSGWTTTLSKGDILRFNIDSTLNITRLTISLSFVVPIPAPAGALLTENGDQKKISEVPTVTATSGMLLTGLNGSANVKMTAQSVANLAPGGGGGGAVSQIVAGSNVTVSPPGGTGVVTISSTGGAGSGAYPAGGIAQITGFSATNTPAAMQFWINASNPAFGNLASSPRAAIQAAIDYAFNNGYTTVYIPRNAANSGFHNIDGPIFIDFPNNLRNGISLSDQKLGVVASPSHFGLGITVICDPFTYFNYNWETSPCFWLGTAEGNILINAFVHGPASGLNRFNHALDPRCISYAIAGGSGGATQTILQLCRSELVYAHCTTGSNGQDALAEDNEWIDCQFTGGAAYGIKLINSQALVNKVTGGGIGGSYSAFYNTGQGIIVIGGEHGQYNTEEFTANITGLFTNFTSFSTTIPGGKSITNYRFDLTGIGNAAQLDGSFKWRTCQITLPGFGPVPCSQTAFNSGTNTGTFTLDSGWVFHHFGEELALSATDFTTEMAAATSMDLGVGSYVFAGRAAIYNAHIENIGMTMLYNGTVGNSGQSLTCNDVEMGNWQYAKDFQSAAAGRLMRIWPFFRMGIGPVIFDNCVMPPGNSNNVSPAFWVQGNDVYNNVSFNRLVVRNCTWGAKWNIRYVGDAEQGGARQRGPGWDSTLSTHACYGTKAFGVGEFDRSVWMAATYNGIVGWNAHLGGTALTSSNGTRPAPGEHTRITQADANSLLAGAGISLCGGFPAVIAQAGGQTGSYCVDVGGSGWSAYADTSAFNWSYVAGTQMVKITNPVADFSVFFTNGQEIFLDNGSDGAIAYIVNGVNVTDGWVYVYRANSSNSVLVGTVGTTYTGSTITSRRCILSFPGQTRSARISGSNVTATSNTTPADITGLSIAVAKLTYEFTALLYTTSNVAGGVKVQFGGTCTVSALRSDIEIREGTTIAAVGSPTALGSAIGVTAVTVALVRISGTFTVSAVGTFTIQGAQNASNGSATTFLIGSSLSVKEIA